MKTHLDVHNIKQREGESTRAFINIYTDDTLQILGLHEEQRISGFIHGLRTQSLVEHLSTDLSSTYKGLMDKTYTWVEVLSIGQKDRGRFSPYKGQNHKLLANLVKSPREILATEKVAKTSEQPLRLPGANLSKDKTRYCHFHEDYGHEMNHCRELKHQIEEAVKSGQLAHWCTYQEVPSIGYSNTPLVGFSGEQSWPLGEIPLEVMIGEGLIAVTKPLTFVILKSDSPHDLLLGRTAMQQMGIVVSIVHGAIKFHTPRGIGTIFMEYNSQKPKEEEDGPTNKYQGNEENVLSCIDTKERMVINDKTSKAKEEKPSPKKKQSDPQLGATYQKLIDKVVGHQMGRNIEVNVDDMVIKSDSEEEMMADITETLERLQAINLKLNSKNAPSEWKGEYVRAISLRSKA
ncbi:hypothetical protein Tco_0631018 [Tanacetum coccineum]